MTDVSTGDYFELVLADNEPPLDVFYHPFAHARRRGVALEHALLAHEYLEADRRSELARAFPAHELDSRHVAKSIIAA